MRQRVTRRRFLSAMGAGATYLALTNAVGCDLSERAPQAETQKGGAPSTPKVSHLPSASPAPREGAWAFRSRPDFTPPAVEVTAQAHDTAPGYIFLAPEKGGAAGKGGSMIIDDGGQVVWFYPLRGPYGRTMNFQTQTYQDRDVLIWGQTPGEYVIFDSSYRKIASFTAANGHNGDHHEFLISPQDTALITIYNAVPHDLSSVGGSKDGLAWQGVL